MHRRRVALTVVLAGLALLAFQTFSAAGGGSRQIRIAQSPTGEAVRTTPTALTAAKSPPRGTPTPNTEPSPSADGSDVSAVSLNKGNKIALVDPAELKVSRTIDAGVPPGSFALAPDRQIAWVFSTKEGDNVVSVV